ncbi:unnamed protein product [Moneuplotes crassus]|uniref:Uncharacterized protein n=1 Tax=Euplotes crassus TaxID=5936 RepID=A0AAD1XW42_EUPCR|nr:unnamed protein product [Moneuplotes crassus]
MVKRLIMNLILEYGGKVAKSVSMAYKRVASGEGGAKQSFDKFQKKTFGRMMNTPMTREESVKILGIEKSIENIQDDIDPTIIMERFDEMFSKNESSFYLQSKVYFAKEFLMQDYPPELNISKYNPDESAEDETEEKDQTKEESKEEESKEKSKNKSDK